MKKILYLLTSFLSLLVYTNSIRSELLSKDLNYCHGYGGGTNSGCHYASISFEQDPENTSYKIYKLYGGDFLGFPYEGQSFC